MVKVMWIVNITFPRLAQELGLQVPFSGGWLFSLANLLVDSKTVRLTVVSVDHVSAVTKRTINGIHYVILPKLYRGDLRHPTGKFSRMAQDILDVEQPDILHVHGSEFSYGLAFMSAKSGKVVLSLQGITREIHRHFQGECNSVMSVWERTLYLAPISLQRSLFKRRLRFEREYFSLVTDVIGRTNWDRAISKQYSQSVMYHKIDEPLREEFYRTEWNPKNVERYSLLVSQGAVSYKGLHNLLYVLPDLKAEFPQIKVYVAGNSASITTHRLKKRLGYHGYINRLINKAGLTEHIVFLGPQSPSEMANLYKRANVFLLLSSVENSPNSLVEAMTIGTPCIAADVGGVSDFVQHGVNGFTYRYQDRFLISEYIRMIFNDPQLGLNLSTSSRTRMKLSRQENNILQDLERIYNATV